MSVKVIWKTKKPGDRLGYIRLSSRIAGKTVLKNLPLEPVEKNQFMKTTYINSKTGLIAIFL